jgi:hypothetical protein
MLINEKSPERGFFHLHDYTIGRGGGIEHSEGYTQITIIIVQSTLKRISGEDEINDLSTKKPRK